MTLYIGVDIHARQQTLAYLDTEDGTTGQLELQHERDDVKGFYSKLQGEVIVGIRPRSEAQRTRGPGCVPVDGTPPPMTGQPLR